MSLPTGTITFLFTDIEGSTRLWEEQPDTMRLALARHDALLRAAIETNGGSVFKTIGDAFCAAFATAPQALEAALMAQRSLLQVKAGVGSDLMLKVRMALHTGAADPREGDYFGQPLNRVARLLAAGHGGQVLLSDVAHDLVRDTLPSAAATMSLGEHRLRDLHRPEQVFQVLHPDLPHEFPPIKSLDNPLLPNNLPQQMTSFIGREKEMAELKGLLHKARLLTLTGSGGSGKSRLALQAAADMLEDYPDGVWLVELAPLSDPSLVPQAAAQTLGIKEKPGQSLEKTLAEDLKTKSLLLLVDNCEHLLSACAAFCAALLRSCPHLKILASSREALGVAGEQSYRIPSLSLPDPRQPFTVESISRYEAVRLFIERAALSKSDFAVTNHNAPALASVCHRLDGIPLAIELAAARIRSLSVEDINARLDNRFRLLTGGSRTTLPRQQTLRALIDWSYDLLKDSEKTLLNRLSVFAGGCSLEAAEQVGSAPPQSLPETERGRMSMAVIEDWEVLDLLTSLVDKSLVLTEERGAHLRYRLLETVRQYAAEKLRESGEAEEARSRHRDLFLALAEEAGQNLQGEEQAVWLERLEMEHDNLRVALVWCQEDESGSEPGLRLAGSLWEFWEIHGHLSEGRSHLRTALEREGAQEPSLTRARALNAAGILAYQQGDYSEAHPLHAEALTIQQQQGDKRGKAHSLLNLAHVASNQGDNIQAQALYEEGLILQREIGNRWGIALSLLSLGSIVSFQGDLVAARDLYKESLALYQELGTTRSIATALRNLSWLDLTEGDYASAKANGEKSLSICREIGDRKGIASALNILGWLASIQGDHASARANYAESLVIFREIGDRRGIADVLSFLGKTELICGDYDAVRANYEESLSLCRENGDREGIAYALNSLGWTELICGDYAAARTCLEESLSLYREIGDRSGAASSLINLGIVAKNQGDYASARSLYEQSLSIQREIGNRKGIAEFLEAFAVLEAAQGQFVRSAALWSAAAALREEMRSPMPADERQLYEPDIAAARKSMGEEAFSAAIAKGRAMTMDQAIEYALE